MDSQLDEHRDRIINYLTELFSRDVLTTEEYELRVEKANEANSPVQLNDVVSDLQIDTSRNPGPSQGETGLDISSGRDSQRVLAVLGSRELQGNWLRKDTVLVQSFMSSVTCDLRDVALPEVTRIQIYSMMAEVVIILPEGVVLETNVAPILGEVNHKGLKKRHRRDLPVPQPGRVVQINGLAIMSEVSIRQ
ncbi:DUF1707 domain-containing protein [Salinispira pacifica]|uniref:DUF1707 domain-containing protein n=1 Tax=Salinispira pacifica TaxID=1307761 RepID=V5WLA9_9SPIO|nr:DUF1707 domain-containing protein [Salinispira pacifica]AHC16617.1 hypothetical protein L21SP2_3277 [Salinispira pacifica]